MARNQTQNRDPNAVIDWGAMTERTLAGDRIAFAALARLVTGYLTRWRAIDFRSDWDDIVQEVLVSSISAYREGRLADPVAFQAYVRQATRFKFIDKIRSAGMHSDEADPALGRDRRDVAKAPWPPKNSLRETSIELALSVRRAVSSLDERERAAVLEVHLRGRTYDEAALITGIPLGSLKRALRTGLARLRETLGDDPPD